MAQAASFDITTGVDLQEVDNAVNQAQKEIATRYDFKGSKSTIELKKAENLIALTADSDFQMRALFDVLQAKLIKRGVPVKNLDIGDIKPAGGDESAEAGEQQDQEAAGEPHRPSGHQSMHIGADADAGSRCHRSIMPHGAPATDVATMNLRTIALS